MGFCLTGLIAFGELLDEFSRGVTGVGEHQRSIAFEGSEDLLINTLSLQCLLQQGVLCHQQFHIALEAEAAQGAGLLCIQTFDIGDVEVLVLVELLLQSNDNRVFIFLFHCLKIIRGFTIRGINQSIWYPP